jgi:hypothetical protein
MLSAAQADGSSPQAGPTWQSHLEAAEHQLGGLIETACNEAAARLRAVAMGASSRDDARRAAARATARLLPAVARQACRALSEACASSVRGAAAPVPGPGDPAAFEFLDEDAAVELVETARLAQLLEECAEWSLQQLRLREADLRDSEGRPAEASPIGPAALARHLWQGSEALNLDIAAQAEAVRGIAAALMPKLDALYAGLARAAQVPAKPAAAAGSAAAPSPPSSAAARQAEVPGFDLTRPGALRKLLPAGGPADPISETMPLPFDGDDVRIPQIIRRHSNELSSLPQRDNDWAVVELISRLFELVVDHPDLPEIVKPMFTELMNPVVSLALRDAELLDSHRHPSWVLTNKIASEALTLGATDEALLPEFVGVLGTVIGALGLDPVAADFELAVARIQKWHRLQVMRKLAELSPRVEQLRQQERALPTSVTVPVPVPVPVPKPAVSPAPEPMPEIALETACEMAPKTAQGPSPVPVPAPEPEPWRERLQSILDTAAAPAEVMQFLLAHWTAVCSRAAAGNCIEDSADLSLPQALEAAATLVWSTDEARTRSDAPALLARLPELQSVLRRGLALIGQARPLQDAWFERLAALHGRVLEPAATPAPAPASAALPKPAPAAAADAAPASPQALEADVLSAIRVGDSVRLQLKGGWTVVQLLWVSGNGHFLLFSSSNAGRTHSFTRRALQRLADAGMMEPLEDRSALERAADFLSSDFMT